MNLLKALAQTSSMTLLSRILGYIRDAVIAHAFGAGGLTDAFFVAFRIPNLLRRLFAEGAFSQAFVPLLADAKAKEGDDSAKNLIDHVSSFLAVVVFVTTLLGVIFAPQVVYLSAPGFRADSIKFNTTVDLLRVTFPYIFFITLVSLSAGILNTWNRFWIPAFTPVLLNLSFILCALFLAPHLNAPIMALAWGAFMGGVLQLFFQIPFLKQINMLPRFRLALHDKGVRRVLKLMAPAVVGVSVGQISLLVSTIFASFLPTGSVSWLFYADRLMEFPTGLLGAALGTILLPSLVKHHSLGHEDRYSDLLDWGLRLTLVLTVPAAAALAVAGIPLISTLFLRGAFLESDATQVYHALIAYSLGLTGLIGVKILAPGFYARQDIKTPVKIAIMVLFITQLMNVLFMQFFAHAGLALATGLGACINATWLLIGLKKRGLYHAKAGWAVFLVKIGIATLVMSAILWWGQGNASLWLTGNTLQHLLRLIPLLTIAAVSYFLSLWLMGLRFHHFKKEGA
ncbi:MAG: murein biosynthesis integral membrane protein MurJ [Betaproteobacteria bacterium]|nr:murein biosynthesis integral membrane protein MurJ [Betaproteobacteria bacterium]